MSGTIKEESTVNGDQVKEIEKKPQLELLSNKEVNSLALSLRMDFLIYFRFSGFWLLNTDKPKQSILKS